MRPQRNAAPVSELAAIDSDAGASASEAALARIARCSPVSRSYAARPMTIVWVRGHSGRLAVRLRASTRPSAPASVCVSSSARSRPSNPTSRERGSAFPPSAANAASAMPDGRTPTAASRKSAGAIASRLTPTG